MYYEVPITKHHAGFDMWQAGEANGDAWLEESDLIQEIAMNVYEMVELGVEDLPAEVEDIRGHIYNEPARVFAMLRTEDAPVEYLGIVEKE